MTTTYVDNLVAYYICLDVGDVYFENRARLWITHQLHYIALQEWCFELDWVGA